MTRRRIMITGGSGFIGSNLINYWHRNYPNDMILNLDKASYAATDMSHLDAEDWYLSTPIDLAQPEKDIEKTLKNFEPHGIFHLAAETHVDRSIKDPLIFEQSNVAGTLHLLEAMRNVLPDVRLVQVSTDEVFGDLAVGDTPFSETTPFKPSSPYSASKASADHFARAYCRTYGMDICIGHSTNNYGPRQHDEKLIPTVIRNAVQRLPIPIYGSGGQLRDWIYVEDHCAALDRIFHGGKSGESYCIGAVNEIKNTDLVQLITSILDDIHPWDRPYRTLIRSVDDRPGHDFRYSVQTKKIQTALDWKPEVTFQDGIERTVLWYLQKYAPSLGV